MLNVRDVTKESRDIGKVEESGLVRYTYMHDHLQETRLT
jgi:hypothetical protein